MIKQRKDRYGGVGGDREGKMTYLGSTGCSGILHPAHAAAAFHRGKSPSIPPTRRCHNPPPTLATCVDVCPCVCVSPLFFPDIPVRSREALDSTRHRETGPKIARGVSLEESCNLVRAGLLLQLFVSITSRRGFSGLRRYSFGDICPHDRKKLLGQHLPASSHFWRNFQEKHLIYVIVFFGEATEDKSREPHQTKW